VNNSYSGRDRTLAIFARKLRYRQMREQTQCASCDLVQFRTKTNSCRRCRTPLPERPPVRDLKPEPPAIEIPVQPPRCTVPLGVILPLEETVRRAVLDAVDKCEGNILLAAKYLGVGKTTVYRYLRDWGWTPPHSRQRFRAQAVE
jgi:transcriptional regulator of acetoin/glycerol metabolism